jgi:hypothetical protein
MTFPPAMQNQTPRERDMAHSFRTHLFTSTGSSSSPAGGSSGPTKKDHLRAQHPDWSNFMIEMKLYQDEEQEEARADEERLAKRRKDKNRVEQRLRSLDALTTVPQLLDRDGKPVAIEGDALSWLEEHHPTAAARYKKVMQMARSHEIDAKHQRVVESDDALEAGFVKKDAERTARYTELIKERDSIRKYYATKREEGFQKVLARRDQIREDHVKSSLKLLKKSRTTLEERARETQHQREARSEALRQNLEAADLKAKAKREEREQAEERQRRAVAKESAQKLLETSARRHHELDEHLKQRLISNDEERINTAREHRLQHERQLHEAKTASLAKKNKDLTTFWKSVEEERRYTANLKNEKHEKVMSRSMQQRDALIEKELELLERQQCRLGDAEARREAYLQGIRDTIAEREEKLNISPRRGNLDDSAAVAAAIKEREARFFTPRAPNSPRQGFSFVPKTTNISGEDGEKEKQSTMPHRSPREHKAGYELAEEHYAAQLKKLETCEKEMEAALKRRQILIDAEKERKQMQRDKLDALRDKALRRAAFEADQEARAAAAKKEQQRQQELQQQRSAESDGDPPPPCAHPEEPAALPSTDRSTSIVASPLKPPPPMAATVKADAIGAGEAASAPRASISPVKNLPAASHPTPRPPRRPHEEQLAAASQRYAEAKAAAAAARTEALRLREQRDAAAAALREAELRQRQEVAAHLGREKDLSYYRDLREVLSKLDAKKNLLEETEQKRRSNLMAASVTQASQVAEQQASAVARREEKERMRINAILERSERREELMSTKYSIVL